jgi:hypothetical protein
MSPDGRFVALSSNSGSYEICESSPFLSDLYVRDLQTGATDAAVVHDDGSVGGASLGPASLSSGADVLAFASGFDDLVPGDTGFDDVFVRDGFGLPPTPLFSDVLDSHRFRCAIGWLVDDGIAHGYPDGTFRPATSISRQAIAAFLFRFADEPAFTPPSTPTFPDVPVDHPFFHEIEWLASTDMTDGYPDGTFRPTATVTRQAMAAFLYRLAGEPAFSPPSTPTYLDVPTDHPFFAEIEWLTAIGVAEGYDDETYRPTTSVSRQAMSAFLQRYALWAA